MSIDVSVNNPLSTKIKSDIVTLSIDQQNVIKLATEGKSMFISGFSGSGKTSLIGHLVFTLSKQPYAQKHPKESKAKSKTNNSDDPSNFNGLKVSFVGVVATAVDYQTAVQLGAIPICEMFRMPLQTQDINIALASVTASANLHSIKNMWNSFNVLIIDNIQNMHPFQFICMMRSLQIARSSNEKMQFIFLGDFLSHQSHHGKYGAIIENGQKIEHVFQLDCWKQILNHKDHVFMLDTAWRHQHDLDFARILNSIRLGFSQQTVWADQIMQRFGMQLPQIPYAHLLDKKLSVLEIDQELQQIGFRSCVRVMENPADVNAENLSNLHNLKTSSATFSYQYGYRIGDQVTPLSSRRSETQKLINQHVSHHTFNEGVHRSRVEYLRSSVPVEHADESITLKVGTFVILMADLHYNKGLVCGRQGVVVGFTQTTERPTAFPIVRFDPIKPNSQADLVIVRPYMWYASLNNTCDIYLSQIPLIYGWAIPFNRISNLSLQTVAFKPTILKQPGLFYYAISKVLTLEGVYFESQIQFNFLQFDPICLQFESRMLSIWKATKNERTQKLQSQKFNDLVLVTEDVVLPQFGASLIPSINLTQSMNNSSENSSSMAATVPASANQHRRHSPSVQPQALFDDTKHIESQNNRHDNEQGADEDEDEDGDQRPMKRRRCDSHDSQDNKCVHNENDTNHNHHDHNDHDHNDHDHNDDDNDHDEDNDDDNDDNDGETEFHFEPPHFDGEEE